MNLATTAPRSPKEKLAGIVSFKRTIDKAKAYNEGTLGEYDYDCPHDKPLFEFLETDGEEFARRVRELESDEAIAQWARSKSLSKKAQDDVAVFNDERLRWHPLPGTHSAEVFENLRSEIAPDRPDVVTWFDLLDLDEGREVPRATSVV